MRDWSTALPRQTERRSTTLDESFNGVHALRRRCGVALGVARPQAIHSAACPGGITVAGPGGLNAPPTCPAKGEPTCYNHGSCFAMVVFFAATRRDDYMVHTGSRGVEGVPCVRVSVRVFCLRLVCLRLCTRFRTPFQTGNTYHPLSNSTFGTVSGPF